MRRWLWAMVLLGGSSAFGKNISITTTQRTELKDGQLVTTVQIGNAGDEAALSVTPILRFRDQTARGRGKPQLAPSASFDEALTLSVGQLGDGRWPFAIAIDYTDANQYPFQALQVTTITVGDVPPAKIAVPEIKADPIAGSGAVRVKVKNLAAAERRIELSFHVPEGLEVAMPRREIALDKWAEQALELEVTNRTALPGSRYPVFITAEYDDDGKHQAIVAQGIVEIVPGETFFDRHAQKLLIGAGLLVGVWILAVVLRGVRR